MFTAVASSHSFALSLFSFGIITWVWRFRTYLYLIRHGKRMKAAVVDIHIQTIGDIYSSHTNYITSFMTPDTQTGRQLTFFLKTPHRPPYQVGELVNVWIDPLHPNRYLIVE
jgi:hypothetical protein